MAIDPGSAIAAYAKAASAKTSPGASAGAEAGGLDDFGTLLSEALSDAVKTAKTSEAQMAAGAAGKGDLIDVVTAVTAAETTLETVIAVRDRVIAAYQEVMKMPV
jgi:flagellar hook-basal body complex protein FliE